MKKFEAYLVEQGKSSNTISSYLQDLKSFFSFIGGEELSRENVQAYRDYLLKQNKSSATINRHLTAIRQYNNYLNVESEYVVSKDFIKIQRSKVNPNTLVKSQVDKFLHELKRFSNYRNYAIAMTILNTGLRIEECLSLRLDNLDLDCGIATVIGKGNKERIVDILPEGVRVLKEYISKYRIEHKYASTSPYVFVSRKGERLNRAMINQIFSYYSDGKITPHMLRHYFATEVYNQMKDILYVRDQLGHADLATTQIYTHPTRESRKEQLSKIVL